MKLRKEAIGWMFYDFANSAFTTVIVTVVFSVYFVQTIASGRPEGGEWLWSQAIAISMTLAAIFAPILGAMADYSRSKKRFLLFFTILTIISTALLYFVGQGDLILAMILFIIANFSFNSANVFYDAFLPEVGMKKDLGRISGLGWGFGYIGGLVTLILALALIDKHIKLVWPMVALHILIFSSITFLTLKEKKYPVQKKNYFKVALDRVLFSFKHIKKMPDLLNFLISYFLYNIGIYTVIVYAAIFGGAQFGMTQQSLIIFFIIAQVTSFVGAALFGLIADKLNVRLALSISLIIWVVVVVWAFFCNTAQEYYYLGLLAGLAIGSSQANSRTMLSLLTPLDKQAEFFGFYTLVGRISAIIGPFVYGEITRLAGNQRYAIISLMVFFIAGWIMLHQVKLERGIKFGQEYVFK
ncbi:MAG TPA: MFS transporter [Candidatus Syntrophosphaera thermopropionivorans]|jgi:UMF1 family MFS transporter|nr:MFS transporter [Candidatus Syntrophosphaera sp.]HOJ41870.1 MFS transporter [Candidatus Syntrophosphaera thermopropionivorans]HON32817.1 MFS transporter [Candidatus Syntrophosphaera thermopropionivorans]HQK57849.1 MFS transporter [Candidatus Syntrophosphaera thermopropionivorans]HRR97811.1 MFS transporter [Candidatus Syntrophosphaera sp.]